MPHGVGDDWKLCHIRHNVTSFKSQSVWEMEGETANNEYSVNTHSSFLLIVSKLISTNSTIQQTNLKLLSM